MKSSLSGEDGIQPFKFSECSLKQFQQWMEQGSALCLLNRYCSIHQLNLNSIRILKIHSTSLFSKALLNSEIRLFSFSDHQSCLLVLAHVEMESLMTMRTVTAALRY